MKHIVLINAPVSVSVPKAALPPLPLLVLGGCLKRLRSHGTAFGVELLDLDLKLKLGDYRDDPDFYPNAAAAILERSPSAALFTTHGDNLPIVLQIAREVKSRNPHVLVVLGGVNASLQAVSIIKNFDQVDLIVKGAGEPAMRHVLAVILGRATMDRIPSCVYRRGNRPIETAATGAAPEDAAIAFPDYDLIDLSVYRAHNARFPYVTPGFALVETGRGCRWRCSFCAPNAMWNGRPTQRAIEDIIREMRFLAAHGFDLCFFTQDNLDASFLRPFCRALIDQSVGLTWGCYARLDKLGPDIGIDMARAGCRLIFTGIESANPNTYALMNKRLHNDTLFEKIAAFNRLGIRLICSLIACFPGETDAELENTLALALGCSAGMPATELEERVTDADYRNLPDTLVNFTAVHPLNYMKGTALDAGSSQTIRLIEYSLQSDAYGSHLFGLDAFRKEHWQTLGGTFVTHLTAERAMFCYSVLRLFELLCTTPFRFALLVQRSNTRLLPFLVELVGIIGSDRVLNAPPEVLEMLVMTTIETRFHVALRVASRRTAEPDQGSPMKG